MKTLQETALLVKLTRHSFNPSVKDDEVANAVETNMGAALGSGKFYKQLFRENDKIKRLFSKQNDLYAWHIKYTLPWMDGGVRILPAKFYDEYIDTVGKKRTELEQLLSELEPEYATLVTEDQARLGTLARSIDYPSFEVLTSKFGIDVRLFPIPSSSDFRVAVSEDAKRELDSFIEDTKIKAKEDMYQRVKVVLDTIIEQCAKEKPRLHTTLLTNTGNLADVLGILNVHDDDDIKSIAGELSLLANSVSMFNLRTSVNSRNELVQGAKRIKDLMTSGHNQVMTVVADDTPSFDDLI
jgi:hypothetical protein